MPMASTYHGRSQITDNAPSLQYAAHWSLTHQQVTKPTHNSLHLTITHSPTTQRPSSKFPRKIKSTSSSPFPLHAPRHPAPIRHTFPPSLHDASSQPIRHTYPPTPQLHTTHSSTNAKTNSRATKSQKDGLQPRFERGASRMTCSGWTLSENHTTGGS